MEGGRSRGRGRARSNAPPPGGTNGRAHRGARPGARVGARESAAVARQMGAMSLEGANRYASGADRNPKPRSEVYDLVHTRPADLDSKQGQSGRQIALRANYFSLDQKPDHRVYQYKVDLNVEEERTFVRKIVVKRVGDLPIYIFDGTVMYTVEELYPHLQKPEGITKPSIIIIDQVEHLVEVSFKLVGEVHPTDHHYLQVLNIIMKQMLGCLDLQQIGRGHYDLNRRINLTQFNLEVYPGYQTSIRQHESNILVCAEVAHKIVRTDTVYDQIKVIFGRGVHFIKRELIGSIIITQYNQKTYQITDIDMDSTPASSFQRRDGSSLTFADYMESRYGMRVKDMRQPLIISMPKDKDRRGGRDELVRLIPEFCYMTGFSQKQRNNFNLMKTVGEYTRQNPSLRMKTLTSFARTIASNPGCREAVERWGMQLRPEMVAIPDARVLKPEATFFAEGGGGPQDGKFTYREDNPDWSSQLKVDPRGGKGLHEGVPMDGVVLVYPKNGTAGFASIEQDTESLWRELQFVANGFRIRLSDPNRVVVPNDRTATYIEHLRRVVDNRPAFVVVVIPYDRGDTYSAIKKQLLCETPVPNQVLVADRTVKKRPKHRTFATKILLQMQTKLGATPWRVHNPLKTAAVVGFDTYHDTERRGHSYGALVGSLNSNLSRYYSGVSRHCERQEMSNQIPVLFRDYLDTYRNVNETLPRRVFFYRDGVGEGQIHLLLEVEVAEIKKLLVEYAEANDSPPITLTYIVVSKRINTRFFASTSQTVDNPPSGTVVDNVVTLPERHDFFLVSQKVNQGTVTPTSYNIIANDAKLTPDHIQILTYKLTHLYFNWTGTVRVPAPCQYAHKLAYLVGNSLHRQPSRHLSELLYFL